MTNHNYPGDSNPGYGAAYGNAPYPGMAGGVPGAVPGPPADLMARPLGKVRSPWVVIGLTLITFGIYGVYWWYVVFDEVHEYRYRRGPSGVLALILCFLFSIVLPFLFGDAVENAERETGRQTTISALTGCWILIPLLGWFIFVVRAQTTINKLWDPFSA